MPAQGATLLPRDDILSFEEIVAFIKIAVKKGIDKVRLTGGEPLVKRDIISLVAMISKIEGIHDFAMTTNGSFLVKYAQPLKDAGLHRINVSLDTLNESDFKQVTRGGDLDAVLKGIIHAKKVGLDPIKLNCIIKESPDEASAISVAAFAKKHDCDIRYIREMSMHQGTFWKVLNGDGGHCETCNRLRLSSDGRLYPCLFNNKSYSIKDLGYENAIDMAINEKPESGQKNTNQFYKLGG